jgi:hypothetical protein
VTPAEIWKKLTPSQRVTLLEETHPHLRYGDLYRYGDEALVRAGLKLRGRVTAEHSSGSARHALGRKGLLDVGQTISMPTSAAGFHTPRKPTVLGQSVADHGVALLGAEYGHGPVHSTKKTAAQLDREIAEALAGEHYYFVVDRDEHRTIYGPYDTQKDAEYAGYFAKPVDERDSLSPNVYFGRGVQRYDADEIKALSRDPGEYELKSFKLRRGAPPVHASWKKFDAEFRNYLRDSDYEKYQQIMGGR